MTFQFAPGDVLRANNLVYRCVQCDRYCGDEEDDPVTIFPQVAVMGNGAFAVTLVFRCKECAADDIALGAEAFYHKIAKQLLGKGVAHEEGARWT